MSHRPFNATRAAFYLVAAVICVHLLLSVVATFACILAIFQHVIEDRNCTDGKILEVLSAALAAALAFAGGRMSKD